MKKIQVLFLILLSVGVSLMLSACGGEETPLPTQVEPTGLDAVIVEGRVLPHRDLRLNFSTEGRVAEILVEEGEQVSRGAVLIHLADREQAEAALREAELSLTAAQQELEDLLRLGELETARAWQAYQDAQIRRAEAEREWEDLDIDRLEDEIDDARIEVEEREDDLEDAEEELENYLDVDEDNFLREAAEEDVEQAEEDLNEARRLLEESQREIDSVRAELDAALAAEEEAQREYQLLLEEGVDPDRRRILESRVSAAEAQLAAAENLLDRYTLEAPFAGTVTDIYLEEGQFVHPNVTALQMADLTRFRVETSDLTELEVVRVSPGQEVEIVPDALPNVTLTGRVERISHSFTTQAGDILYTVLIELEESHPDLRWGMTLELTFPLEEAE